MHMQIVTKNIVGCIKNGTVGQALANEFFSMESLSIKSAYFGIIKKTLVMINWHMPS